MADNHPELFFHCEGNSGAGIYQRYHAIKDSLRLVGSKKVSEVRPDDPRCQESNALEAALQGLHGMTDGPGGLGVLQRLLKSLAGDEQDEETAALPRGFQFQFTFCYPAGRGFVKYEMFDIRPEVCRMVGGFEHGQVVREPDGDEAVVVGVLPDTMTNRPALWFCDQKSPGAWQYGHYSMMRRILKAVGTKRLEQAEAPTPRCFSPDFIASLRLNFRFGAGLIRAEPKLFDIRDEICEEVGGFSHGQLLRNPTGDFFTVVGVRLDDSNTPALWFLPCGQAGAGTISIISSSPEHARRIFTLEGREVLTAVHDENEHQEERDSSYEPESEAF